VLGPANAAKAREVLGAYAAEARRGAALVVPTATDAQLYSRELAAGGTVLGGSVLTFPGLVREIARRCGYSARRVSPLQRERLLARALARAGLEVFRPVATAPGFASAAGELIAELGRSLVTPQRFAQALGAWAGSDPGRAAFGRELGALYGGYARELERLGRVDDELYAWRSLDALRAAPASWGDDPVFFYGFDDLHPLERDAVETLARIAGAAVTVSLTYEAGRDALGARAEAVAELSSLAERVDELPALDEHYAEGSREALHRLERGLFEGVGASEGVGVSEVDPGGAVRLLEAGGERAEAELIAAEVLELLRAGVQPGEIVICHRSPARIAGLYRRVFAEAGELALACDYELPLSHTTLGRGVLALARCALLDEPRADDLLDYLRSPGLLERVEIADAVEAALRRQGLRGLGDARAQLGWELDELDAVRRDPAGGLIRQARRLLAAPVRGTAAVLEGRAALDARALSVLERALGELADVGELERLAGAELIELLAALAVPAGGADRTGAVLLSEPLAIRARRFRFVFVCGLCEGEFPLPGVPEPFLSDERRRELAVASGLRLRSREDSLARERYLFYSCVSRATEGVVLSYRSSDEEGNLALPSPFIADVAELFDPGWSSRRRTRLLADVVWPLEQAPTEREQLRSRAALGAPSSGAVPESVRELTAAALARVRHSEIVSAGALETFAACPVKWLVSRELQPARIDPDPEPLARGSYIHDVLERLLRRLGGPITAASLPDARRILDQLLAELPAPVPPGRPAAVRAAAEASIAADLRRYLAYEARVGAGFAQAGLELRFGFDVGEDEAAVPPLPALELAEGVRLRGVIDRVDTDGAGHAIVRDYKSGRVRPEYPVARWSVDRQLQVALYMLATRELLRLEPVAGFYQPLGGDKPAGRGAYLAGAEIGVSAAGVVDRDKRTAEELDAELSDAASRAVALARRLRSGELTPCPETCTRGGCAFPGICRAV
jgi:RecB family exonuclease